MTTKGALLMTTWINDKLDRQTSAKFLTDYLNSRYQRFASHEITDSFVLAINAEWGFGKSFLLRNWQTDLEESGHPVVYFDAWKNDFTGEPLVGFISEIDSSLKVQLKGNTKAQTLLKKTLNGAKKLIRPAAITATEILLKKITSHSIEEIAEVFSGNASSTSETISETIDKAAIEILDKCADEALKEHKNTQVAIQTFRDGLENLVSHIKTMDSKKLPIFILIDELDRCRPTYSVELLENVKHLFGVNGVYFVIATNVTQLSHSVNALYGSSFDSNRYLKRFFDQEYQLPDPDNDRYANYLFSLLGLDTETRFFTGLPPRFYPETNLNIKLFSLYSTFFKLSLRDQEQVASALNAIVLTWKHKVIHLNYLLFLMMLKHRSPELFEELHRPGQDKAIFIASIRKITDTTVSALKNAPKDAFHEKAPIKTDLLEIAWAYVALANQDLKIIAREDIDTSAFPSGVIKSKIRQEMPSTYYPHQDYPPSLQDYRQIVSQAGQLMHIVEQ